MSEETSVVQYKSQQEMEGAGQQMLREVEGLKVTSRETYGAAVEATKVIKRKAYSVEDFFKAMKQKTHEAHKAVCDQEKAILQYFTKAETLLKQRMRGWEQIEAARQRKAEEKVQQAVVEAVKNREAPPVVKPVENKAHIEGVSYADNWVGQVVNFQALVMAVAAGKAPWTFLQVNEQEVRKFAKATAGKGVVAGVVWSNERTVRISA